MCCSSFLSLLASLAVRASRFRPNCLRGEEVIAREATKHSSATAVWLLLSVVTSPSSNRNRNKVICATGPVTETARKDDGLCDWARYWDSQEGRWSVRLGPLLRQPGRTMVCATGPVTEIARKDNGLCDWARYWDSQEGRWSVRLGPLLRQPGRTMVCATGPVTETARKDNGLCDWARYWDSQEGQWKYMQAHGQTNIGTVGNVGKKIKKIGERRVEP